MSLDDIISWIMMAFCLIGAADYAFGKKLGLAEEFEHGILTCGRLILTMSGFMILAPFIAQKISPIIAPMLQSFGADPSIFAGLLLANDAGGAVLAMELANDTDAGLYSGLIVGSMLGTTIMFNIPIAMSSASPKNLPNTIYGILFGIITIPIGSIAGGLVAGFSPKMVLINTVPVLVLSCVLLIMILTLRNRIVPIFSAFGRGLLALSMFGFACGVLEYMSGIRVLSTMETLDSVFPVVGGIAIFLGGAFSFFAVVRRVLSRPLGLIGEKLKIDAHSVSSLVLTLANPMPAYLSVNEMCPKGQILNVAFAISGGCILGDHLAYTSQFAPEMCTPVIVGKGVAGVTAVLLAFLFMRKSTETAP